jgi:hypothetical protein
MSNRFNSDSLQDCTWYKSCQAGPSSTFAEPEDGTGECPAALFGISSLSGLGAVTMIVKYWLFGIHVAFNSLMCLVL